jgi:hypothetical protein
MPGRTSLEKVLIFLLALVGMASLSSVALGLALTGQGEAILALAQSAAGLAGAYELGRRRKP